MLTCHSGVVIATFVSASLAGSPNEPVSFIGEEPGDQFGSAVSPAGDVNQDGHLDVLVGAPSNTAIADFAGRCYLFHGPFTDAEISASDAAATFTAEGFGDNLGVDVASAGDVNNDGVPDIILGARGNDAAGIQAGRAYVFFGPVVGAHDVIEADVIISGQEFQEVGWSLLGGFDINDDGFHDIAVGGPQTVGGRAYVFFGPLSGELSTASADVTITSAAAFDQLGWSLAAADLNGDGMVDLAIGAPGRPIEQTPPGQVFVFFGPVDAGTISAGSADVIFVGAGANDHFGRSVAVGDLDGDSLLELIVGADQEFIDDVWGKCHVFKGRLMPGEYNAATADATIVADDFEDTLSGLFGEAVSSPGDVNGDGFDDLLIGDALAAVGGSSRAGQAYLFHGPVSGALNASDADQMIPGGPDDRMGDDVAGVGDVDGDGLADFFVGAPDASSSETDAGRAVLLFSNDQCPADLDGSGVVDVMDLLIVLGNWGTDGDGAGIAPPNDIVDVADLLGLLGAWGECG